MKQLSRYLLLCALAGSTLTQAADLTVEVDGLQNANGTVLVAVYDRAEHFLRKPVRTAAVVARPGSVRFVFADLPAGEVAISVFHDQNGNGKLDTNLVGMPIEPYGFSNDGASLGGPPSFQQSRMALAPSGSLIHINLR